jgi:hypothetical protein
VGSQEVRAMNLGWADPPYPGCAHLYKNHPDYRGEVDHKQLLLDLEARYDGWVLNTSSTALPETVPLLPTGVRIMAWVKPFAAFKKNVPVAYAWEPMIVRPARKPIVGRTIRPLRDWLAESITLKRGLTGAKPERVCWWGFEVMGAEPDDILYDLFPGTGAVTQAWQTWREARAALARKEEGGT